MGNPSREAELRADHLLKGMNRFPLRVGRVMPPAARSPPADRDPAGISRCRTGKFFGLFAPHGGAVLHCARHGHKGGIYRDIDSVTACFTQGEHVSSDVCLILLSSFAAAFIQTVTAEVFHPTWARAVDIIFHRATQMAAKPRYWHQAFPLAIMALCVAPADTFKERWVGLLNQAIGRIKVSGKAQVGTSIH